MPDAERVETAGNMAGALQHFLGGYRNPATVALVVKSVRPGVRASNVFEHFDERGWFIRVQWNTLSGFHFRIHGGGRLFSDLIHFALTPLRKISST